MYAPIWLVLIGLGALVGVWAWLSDAALIAAGVVGGLIGAVLRDIAHAERMARTWRFYCELLDWKRIAVPTRRDDGHGLDGTNER
jgi:hypothetical protein